MAQINAYLNFDGNCREAMAFYKDCLGGDLALQTVEGSPVAGQMSAEAQKHILHAALTKGDLVLMASDMIGSGPVKGNSIALSLNCSSEEEISTYFSKLSSGGQITDPLSEKFWGATFGTLTDKFGINWLLNYEKPKA